MGPWSLSKTIFKQMVSAVKRVYYTRPRILALVSVTILGICAGLLWVFGGSTGGALGPNLVADAIMLGLGYLLFERLLEAEAARKGIDNDRVVFDSVQTIYRKAFWLWAGLVALKYDPNEIKSQDLAPFSEEACEAVRNIGTTIANLPDNKCIIESISRQAKDVERSIEREMAYIGGVMEPSLRRLLIKLQHSYFVGHCAGLADTYEHDRISLLSLGANILWTLEQNEALSKGNPLNASVEPDVVLSRENESITSIMNNIHDSLNRLSKKVARVAKVAPPPYQLKEAELILGWYGLCRGLLWRSET